MSPGAAIGWHYYRTDWQDLAWAAWQDYVLAIGLLALTLGLLVPLSRRQQMGQVLFGVAPVCGSPGLCGRGVRGPC